MTESTDERAAFKAAFPTLDHTMKPDAWGRPVHIHPQVDALFVGFKADRASSPPVPQHGEAVLYVSPEQLTALPDAEGEHGTYLPARKTPAGKFTQALYLAPPAKPAQPLSEEEIDDWISTIATFDIVSAKLQGREQIHRFARAIEAAHGIKEKP